jgi:putative transposase
MVYHVLNRSVGRMKLFRTRQDFQAFHDVLIQAHERTPIRLLAWCIMGNHWHFVVWPRRDGELSEFFRWLAHTHAMRWRVAHHTVGDGHLYRGRFKSFIVQEDEHFLTVCRYVERNPLTAGMVRRAENWPWSSLAVRGRGPAEMRALLSDWPVDRPRNWAGLVNEPLTAKELERLELSEERNRPFGDDRWVMRTVGRLHLEHTIRPEGRPPGKVKSEEKRQN